MRKLVLTVAAVIVATTATGTTAQAHRVVKCQVDHGLETVAKCQKKNLAHYRGHVAFAKKYNKGTYAQLVWHRKAATWTSRELNETREAIERKRYLARVASAVGNVSAWLCIHSYEGAWNANTGNGYYGGLQMDWSFMSTYGPELLASKGTANNWTPYEQMMVAERARRSGRGYYPWPNTARKCGLI